MYERKALRFWEKLKGVFDLKRRCAEGYVMKISRERFESIRIRLLSYRSRGTLMYTPIMI